MNRNELTVSDAEELHILDNRQFDGETAATGRSVVSEWLGCERNIEESEQEEL